ncbi:uncharacterized protein BDR25DRAFT_385722 [Lindgomyces ingoldianus]|uniref:Uncharacterized protein n=1 Tax=Lindgomyces ingoldianus TaxID=673940 RepID=A0ACB6R4Z8_9PLEO|nr:uncharacterized protein BDR25DRAFT_385722 [Lindgomyces ingoldianus]KAF2474256.1 hypothetical protein BDR25DRAFT_385722 [Lindgomyces ingoldianus]
MTASLSFPQLSLDLPNSRMSVDFSKFATDFSAITTGEPERYRAPLSLDRIHPPSYHDNERRANPYGPSLPQVTEVGEVNTIPLSRPSSFRWRWYPLSRTVSNASTASNTTTAVSSTFSNLRYHRAGLDHVNLKQVLNHPIFLVSQDFRKATLEIIHTRCQFVIDLHSIYYTNVRSTVDANLKKHQKFWMYGTPQMAKSSLRSLSKLHIRLPVPSTEAGVRRGRDEKNWMDGSDGKGGGGYRVKSLKKEQEDALEIQKCLTAIVNMVMASRDVFLEAPPLTRSLSTLSSLRRKRSTRIERSKSAQDFRPRTELIEDLSGVRKPLKRLEIVFVKRSPSALVLQEVLGFVRELRAVPVTGFSNYYFELNGQMIIWATKRRKRWQGFEPDGNRLLNDLQRLTVPEKPIEPLSSPKEFKYVGVDKKSQQLRLLDSAIRKSAIVLEGPKVPEKDFPPPPPIPERSVRRKLLPRAEAKLRRRVDSFALIMEEGMTELGSIGTVTTGHVNPPTIEDLQKIARDIKEGNY